jgi:GntR family transcriptional regulator, phosphonate transport system regulatory protein
MTAADSATMCTLPLRRDSALPLWQQIESALLQQIREGELCEGTRLPSAFELADRYGVNRHTVRRALEALEARGYVRTESGRGSFVQEHPYQYPICRRPRFSRAMHNLNVVSRYELIEATTVVPDRKVATALGLVARERAHRIVYFTRVEERPIDVSEAWFPAQRFPNLPEVFRRHLSVTRTLAEFGVTDYLRKHTAVMAKLPCAEIARVLGQSSRRPILCVQSVNVDPDGIVVQYGVTNFAGDWVQLSLQPDA